MESQDHSVSFFAARLDLATISIAAGCFINILPKEYFLLRTCQPGLR